MRLQFLKYVCLFQCAMFIVHLKMHVLWCCLHTSARYWDAENWSEQYRIWSEWYRISDQIRWDVLLGGEDLDANCKLESLWWVAMMFQRPQLHAESAVNRLVRVRKKNATQRNLIEERQRRSDAHVLEGSKEFLLFSGETGMATLAIRSEVM